MAFARCLRILWAELADGVFSYKCVDLLRYQSGHLLRYKSEVSVKKKALLSYEVVVQMSAAEVSSGSSWKIW